MLFLGCQNAAKNKNQFSLVNDLTNPNMPKLEEVEKTNVKSIDDVTYKIHKISEEGIKELYSTRFRDTTSEYKNFICFYLDIQSKDYSDIVSYPSDNFKNLNDKIQYLSFMIKDDFTIKTNKTIYKCINSTFDRTYGQIPYARFFLVFDKINESDMTFQFNDYYFNKGEINLKI